MILVHCACSMVSIVFNCREGIGILKGILDDLAYFGGAGEGWVIAPKAGDCNNCAVTKRISRLHAGGRNVRCSFPRSTPLGVSTTCCLPTSAVLVVQTEKGDFVADNLYRKIRIWSEASYE